ncbi:MAG: hypothetical protein E7311_03770 [Clostridiales bacterium]|nr:hypothetical protein [Clostridiales bacterium]
MKECNIRTRIKKDGIVFYSNKHPNLCSQTFLDSSGKIQSKQVEEASIKDDLYMPKVKQKTIVLIDILLVVLSMFIGVYFIKNSAIVASTLIFALFVSTDFLNLLNVSYKVKFGKDKKIGKLIGARNIVLNAYNDLGRIPTLEETNQYSLFYKDVEKKHTLRFIFFELLLCIELTFDLDILIHIAIIGILTILYLIDRPKVLTIIMQMLFTTRPTDEELLIAIEGLKEYEKMEKTAGGWWVPIYLR